MVAAPFTVAGLQRKKGRLYLVTLWMWLLIPSPIAFGNSPSRNAGKIELGFYVWWASFALLALCATALYLRSPSEKILPYPPPQK